MSSCLEFFKQPFLIGSQTFKHRLIQGPLAGISCAPFRALFADYQLPAYAVTEMISAQDFTHRKKNKRRYVERYLGEAPLCYQLSGSLPSVMAEAVRNVEALGADLIDLNVGCPKAKIRQKHCGSAHLDDLATLERVIVAMRKATTKPLTVKIRTAGQTSDNAYLNACAVIENAGADAIIVHGRHWSEDYQVPCALEQIASVKASVSIPVIANGDLHDSESLKACFEKTGCDGYMLARAGIGKPWLYDELLYGEKTIDLAIKISCFMKHIIGLADIEENKHIALLQARRLLKHYFKDDIDSEQIIDMYQCDSIETLNVSLNKWLV
jgi:tRNA-dihydrouridine synthase B